MSSNLSVVIGDAHPIILFVSFLGVSLIGPYLAFSLSNFVSAASIFPIHSSCRSPDLEDVYSYNFPKDRWQIKLLGTQPSSVSITRLLTSSYAVYTVFVLETIQTILNGADMYYWFVASYGDVKHLLSPFASTFDVPIIESVVSLMVELFFVHRIWVLSVDRRSVWFYMLVFLICLVRRQKCSEKKPVLYCVSFS